MRSISSFLRLLLAALCLCASAHADTPSRFEVVRRDGWMAVFFTLWILFCGLISGLMFDLTFASAWKGALTGVPGWIKLLPGSAAIAAFGTVIVLC